MTTYAISEAVAPQTLAKLEALRSQQEREQVQKRTAGVISIIRHLEATFSHNGGQPTYIQVYGLTDEIEKELWPQYQFFRANINLYWVTRG